MSFVAQHKHIVQTWLHQTQVEQHNDNQTSEISNDILFSTNNAKQK